MILFFFKKTLSKFKMDQVASFIHLNRYTIHGNYAFFQHNIYDDECYSGGLYSISTHISRCLQHYLRVNSNDIEIYNNYESPIVYFKCGMKQGNVMEVKGICGNYFWLVKLFDIIT